MRYSVFVKCFYILFISLFCFNFEVRAEVCDTEHINQLKELSKLIYVKHEYIDNKSEFYLDEDGNFKVPDEIIDDTYYINVDLISDKLYLVVGGMKYHYDEWENGSVFLVSRAGEFEIEVHSVECWNSKLRTIKLNLPRFNIYSYKNECKQLIDYDLDICDPWYQGSINDNIFSSVANEYLNKNGTNGILEFLINNYVYGIYLILIFIIGVIIYNKRKNRLD